MLNNNVFYREKIPKYTKYEEKPKEARQIVSYKTKKIYDYYICDYCNQEIRIECKWEKRTGGIMTLPSSLTNKGNIKVALHTKCLKCVLQELENKMIQNNYNHIPRIN